MEREKNVYDSSLFLKNGGDDIYEIATRDGGLCIDGGAAAGHATKILIKNNNVKVWAFEPFPGNFPHFQKNICDNPRVTFYKAALGSYTGKGSFYVSRVIDGSQPGWSMTGYSSEGYLVAGDFKASRGSQFDVDVVRLDELINEDVALLKLDLQGGEFNALLGLGSKVANIRCAYVEFSLDWRTIDFLLEHDFVVFDTHYTGIPKVDIEQAAGLFNAPKIINLSNGYKAVSGAVIGVPRDYGSYKKYVENIKLSHFHHLWSDIIAVNRRSLSNIISAALR